jgi:hypothetical protein
MNSKGNGRDITNEITDIIMIMRTGYKPFYHNKFRNLGEKDKFSEKVY